MNRVLVHTSPQKGSVNINIDTITGDANIQQIRGGVTGNVTGRDLIGGNKEQRSITSGRDYHERIEGDAHITNHDE